MPRTGPLSWNEIRNRAVVFARAWTEERRERAEAQTFWNEFFDVFGVRRRAVASFEEPVRSIRGTHGYIDLFWPGTLIAEHKSRGEPLDKARTQALGYVRSLMNGGRRHEAPRYIVVSDFETIALHDLEPDDADHEGAAAASVTIPLAELHEHVGLFAFIAGYAERRREPEDEVNIRAAEMLADLHDVMEAGGYPSHDLERFMVRVLFCLFAEDTGLFGQPDAFLAAVTDRTRDDGSDLGPFLAHFFEILNTPPERRQAALDETLADLPYVNGDLFADALPTAGFSREMREHLLRCCRFNWGRISPAIFGSLFQSIMQPKQRRQIGAHYTSERDILKLLDSLLLDDLRAKFAQARRRGKAALRRFHASLGEIRVLDPACGCGNFLVVAYRELRLLEIEVLKALHPRDKQAPLFDVRQELAVDVDRFFGIELEEWPARIAEVAMWLMDHQMNLLVSREFGQYVARLPLERSAHIRQANALRIDWNGVLPAERCSFVLGNPPFVGAKFMNAGQREDVRAVWGKTPNAGLLDYVACWHRTATEYLRKSGGRAAFVSTNSVTQGEQAGALWQELFRLGVVIDFAHRTFPWTSEARGKAHVHVVIIGFGLGEPTTPKRIHSYGPRGEHLGVAEVRNISPYLAEGPSAAVTNRSTPLCEAPMGKSGNKPIDNGQYLFEPSEMQQFIETEPKSAKYFKRWLGGREFVQGIERWYLDLSEVEPQILRSMPHVLRRIENVREFRSKSKSAPTRAIANQPTQFHTKFKPDGPYIALPQVSSERRMYIPIAHLDDSVLCGDKLRVFPGATLYHFGVLHSAMHMAWVRRVCGRLESRYQYSITLVYNNFPWPGEVSSAGRGRVERAARAVLDARAVHAGATLADLYDPRTMPRDLQRAHAGLDRAVDGLYRRGAFGDDEARFEHLFGLWERLSAPMLAGRGSPQRRRGRRGGKERGEGQGE